MHTQHTRIEARHSRRTCACAVAQQLCTPRCIHTPISHAYRPDNAAMYLCVRRAGIPGSPSVHGTSVANKPASAKQNTAVPFLHRHAAQDLYVCNQNLPYSLRPYFNVIRVTLCNTGGKEKENTDVQKAVTVRATLRFSCTS